MFQKCDFVGVFLLVISSSLLTLLPSRNFILSRNFGYIICTVTFICLEYYAVYVYCHYRLYQTKGLIVYCFVAQNFPKFFKEAIINAIICIKTLLSSVETHEMSRSMRM